MATNFRGAVLRPTDWCTAGARLRWLRPARLEAPASTSGVRCHRSMTVFRSSWHLQRAVVLLVACGSNTPNAVIGRGHALETIRAPHESILVETGRGAYRVYLDTGGRELVTDAIGATLTRSGIAIYRKDDRWVVEEKGLVRTVDGVLAGSGRIELSPDETRVAVTEPNDVIRNEHAAVVVIALADLAVQRFPIKPSADLMRWTSRSDGLWIEDQRKLFRLDLASGALVEHAREADDKDRANRHDPEICESRGWRLAVVTKRNRQEIWLEPFARREDPERLPALQPHLLMSSTNHSDHNTTHVRRAGPEPGVLGRPMFTRSCDHFVFTLGDSVYVADVATGHYAHLIVGRDPMFAR